MTTDFLSPSLSLRVFLRVCSGLFRLGFPYFLSKLLLCFVSPISPDFMALNFDETFRRIDELKRRDTTAMSESHSFSRPQGNPMVTEASMVPILSHNSGFTESNKLVGFNGGPPEKKVTEMMESQEGKTMKIGEDEARTHTRVAESRTLAGANCKANFSKEGNRAYGTSGQQKVTSSSTYSITNGLSAPLNSRNTSRHAGKILKSLSLPLPSSSNFTMSTPSNSSPRLISDSHHPNQHATSAHNNNRILLDPSKLSQLSHPNKHPDLIPFSSSQRAGSENPAFQ